jgi:cell division protein FtsI/penicillin-binding protein 2
MSSSVKQSGRSESVAPPAPPAATEPSVAPELPTAPGGPGAPGAPGSWPDAFSPSAAPPGPAEVFPPGEAQTPRAAPPPGSTRPAGAPRSGGSPRGHVSRHRKQSERRSLLSGKARLAAVLVVAAGALGFGFTDGFGGGGSAESTVQTFLLDWDQENYAQAAALTDGSARQVSAELAAAYTDLDASNEFFAIKSVTQHGDTAVATYTATVDLAEAGQQWTYVGKFGLTAKKGQWVVNWAPSVINPSLRAGDRLAVVTAYAPRAEVTDMNGQPLLSKSADYRIGVYPGRLKKAAVTAAGLANDTGLDPQQVLGQIQAAPPNDFLSLLTLDPSNFSSLWPKLAKVAGLTYQQQTDRLFDSTAQEVVGTVGTEDSSELREEGAAYEPGMTVGLSGLEQVFQNSLIGTPVTSVVVVDAAGHSVTKLWTAPGGHAGTPVQTTLNSQEQTDAVNALAGQSNSGEIVAVDSATGAIRVLASHEADGESLPAGGALDAEVEPGMAFSIVSAAALLSTGVTANHPLPCEPVADVGGETFTYQPAPATTSTLATDFADGCGTAFANMSRTLTPQQLASTERAFGIGTSWQLRLSAFSGSAPTVSGEADVAAQATGAGGVLMSPLGMATVAAEVDAGTGHSPVLIPKDASTTWQAPLSAAGLTELRQLMRLAVTKGSAQAADLPGTPVYGQAGVVQSGKNSYLSWFVGYRGGLAVAVLETGSSANQAAAALAGTFLSAVG